MSRLSQLSLGQGLLLALLIKLTIAALLPITGDEAYFVLWGRQLDYGYYDHPPMAGWMTWLMLQLSDHPIMIRLPGIATELLIALGLYWHWYRHDVIKARLLALLFLFSPLSLVFVFTLTDTGCMLFAALSSLAAMQAFRHDSGCNNTQHSSKAYAWSALAGVLLGLAFLSKYFAVFLALAYLIYFVAVSPRRWRLGLTLVLVAIPFGLLNLYWNLNHCWTNILFNLVNRNRPESGVQWLDVLSYIGMMAYVVLPPIAWTWWRGWRAQSTLPAELIDADKLARVIVLTALAGFLLVSAKKTIGLHWVLWFYPMVLMALYTTPVRKWQRWLAWMGWFSALHVVTLVAILLVPYSVWQHTPKVGKDLLAATEAPALFDEAKRQVSRESGLSDADVADLPLAAQGYSWASVLSYQLRQPVMVIGPGSKYARQDDFWTDFQVLDGRTVLIYLKRAKEVETVSSWFAKTKPVVVNYRGQIYHFALAEGFDFATYKAQVLRPVRDTFYDIPSWLPVLSCPVTERYFGSSAPAVEAGTAASP